MSVFDVARYILDKKGSMSSWKLQKLCYYAQAWTLAWDGKPLFDEDCQMRANRFNPIFLSMVRMVL